jgi:hypothetical protein
MRRERDHRMLFAVSGLASLTNWVGGDYGSKGTCSGRSLGG